MGENPPVLEREGHWEGGKWCSLERTWGKPSPLTMQDDYIGREGGGKGDEGGHMWRRRG